MPENPLWRTGTSKIAIAYNILNRPYDEQDRRNYASRLQTVSNLAESRSGLNRQYRPQVRSGPSVWL
jgi:hypothetical protein